jgi:hypothetical protein
MYRSAVSAVLGILALTPLLVSAQSIAELQAQIQALLAQVQALEAQLSAGPPTNPASPSAPFSRGACLILGRTLTVGISGEDVAALQRFLAQDASIYPEKNVSGYFGALTEAAVQRFQLRYGIVASGNPASTGYGAVGPRTRAQVQSLSCTQALTPPTLPPSVPLPPPVVVVPVAPKPCKIGNISLPSGSEAIFYSDSSVSASSTCKAQTRRCVNGDLSGSSSYRNTSCTVRAPEACSVNNVQVANGTSRVFYSQTSVAYGQSCSSVAQTRSCGNGDLSGSSQYKYASCSVAGATCSLDGITLAQGSSTTFYFAKQIPSNELCSSYGQTRTCTGNNTLSGNAAYKYATCSPVGSGSCALDNIVLASGAAALFYRHANAPAGELCSAHQLTRTCTNGTLSGDNAFNRAICSNTSACTLDGLTVMHGNSSIFYSARTVPFGSTCASVSQTRLCTNGALSGATTTQYASCSVTAPSASVRQNLAAALAALEGALQKLLSFLGP